MINKGGQKLGPQRGNRQRFPYEPRVVGGRLLMPAELQAIHRYVVEAPDLIPRDNQGETAASIRMRMAAHFPLVGKCDLAVVSDRVKHLIRLEIEGSDIARPSHHRPPDEAVHDLPT